MCVHVCACLTQLDATSLSQEDVSCFDVSVDAIISVQVHQPLHRNTGREKMRERER